MQKYNNRAAQELAGKLGITTDHLAGLIITIRGHEEAEKIADSRIDLGDQQLYNDLYARVGKEKKRKS